jgi:hypothetical protein
MIRRRAWECRTSRICTAHWAVADSRRSSIMGRKHTRSIACRSLDILYVASALELEFKRFSTFDVRQQQLARAAGLKIVIPSPW